MAEQKFKSILWTIALVAMVYILLSAIVGNVIFWGNVGTFETRSHSVVVFFLFIAAIGCIASWVWAVVVALRNKELSNELEDGLAELEEMRMQLKPTLVRAGDALEKQLPKTDGEKWEGIQRDLPRCSYQDIENLIRDLKKEGYPDLSNNLLNYLKGWNKYGIDRSRPYSVVMDAKARKKGYINPSPTVELSLG